MKIRNSETFSVFKKSVLKFVRPSSNLICNYHSPNGMKLITRLRLGLSHLHEHEFRQNFPDTLKPICSCGNNIETSIHYLLHCPNYWDERRTPTDNLQSIGENIIIKMISKSQNCFYLAFLQIMMHQINTCIVNVTMHHILTTKRFDVPLTNSWVVWKTHIFEYIC